MTWGMEHPFLYGVPKSPRWRVKCANWSGQCLKCVNSPHTMRKYVLPALHAFFSYEWTLREVVANTAGTLRQPPSACHQRARFTTTKFVAMRTHKSCKCQPRLTLLFHKRILLDLPQSYKTEEYLTVWVPLTTLTPTVKKMSSAQAQTENWNSFKLFNCKQSN